MSKLLYTLSVFFFLHSAPGVLAAGNIHWGHTESGLRLGIGLFRDQAQSSIEVYFQNADSKAFDLLLGEVGPYPGQEYQVWAVDTRTNEKPKQPLFLFSPISAGSLVSIGLVTPLVVRIPGGKADRIRLPLSDFFLLTPHVQMTLDTALREGRRYKLYVSCEVPSGVAIGSRNPLVLSYPNLWTGKNISGPLLLSGKDLK